MKLTSLPSRIANVSVDVGSQTLNIVCSALSRPGAPAVWEIPNRTQPILDTLGEIHRRARASDIAQLRVIAESTGMYHKLLFRIAAQLGFETNLVDASHVTKMRSILFGDRGKTDLRDPFAIEAVAERRKLITDRRLPELYRGLREWSRLYAAAEESLIDAKCRIHRVLRLLFPDLDFGTDFLYGDSGRAILRCYRFNPHVIATQSPSKIYDRLRKHSSILRRSVDRLVEQARISATIARSALEIELLEYELASVWEDLVLAETRRAHARAQLERLYDELRVDDPRLPDAQTDVISKLALARFFAEAGPFTDYESWRQVLRMGGLNLCERKSGKYVGQTKISRAGRPAMRVVLNQIALPLVRRGHLFGDYYHHKKDVQKMPGKKAMTAVSRKLVKMLWGWYHAEGAFDAARVFRCEGAHQTAA